MLQNIHTANSILSKCYFGCCQISLLQFKSSQNVTLDVVKYPYSNLLKKIIPLVGLWWDRLKARFKCECARPCSAMDNASAF